MRSPWRKPEIQLTTYAEPVLGNLPVRDIDTRRVMKVIEPIWNDKRETASRIRGRIEVILDWAAVYGYRDIDNPARWKGKIDKLLPSRSRTTIVQHHPALPYIEIPAFMASLRQQKGIAAAALEFTILTAARTGEVLGALWSEINFETRSWVIRADRMKAAHEHRVPLAQPAIGILRRMEKLKCGNIVFPSPRQNDESLSNMAMLTVLKRMERPDLTTHGFRSTFRDWVSEQTDTQREVAEAALAHTIGSAIEAAYRRGDLFEKRRSLMGLWGDYCEKNAGGRRVFKFEAKF
jgi:integrase